MSYKIDSCLEQHVKRNSALKRALKTVKRLKRPRAIQPSTGLEGLVSANKILQQKGHVGLLIGGLVETLYTHSGCDSHKDVDVAVLSQNDENEFIESNALYGRGEGGIDWWHPKHTNLIWFENGDRFERDVQYLQNSNRQILGFTFKPIVASKQQTVPGLYIPTPKMIVEYRCAEITADPLVMNVNQKTIEEHERTLKELVNGKLPQFVDPYYLKNPTVELFEVVGFSEEQYSSLRVHHQLKYFLYPLFSI